MGRRGSVGGCSAMRAGVALWARHVGLVVMLQGAAANTAGPNVVRGINVPVVLQPFPDSLWGPVGAPFQTITAKMCEW